MVSFLTSSFVPYYGAEKRKTPLINENGFLTNLRKYWKEPARFLMVSSNPTDYDDAENVARQMEITFSDCGFLFEGIKILDNRTLEEAEALVSWANVIFLSGGHCPTENAFINKINLRKLMKDFDGIFIGLSAGSLNAADETIQIPELKGESEDKDFPFKLPGLGITKLNIIPHANYFRTFTLDGKKYFDDILIPLSKGERLFFIDDGSYFLIDNGTTEFFGTGEIIEDGSVRKISSIIEPEIWKATMEEGFACAFVVDEKTGLLSFKYVSPFLKENGVSPVDISDFYSLIRVLSKNIIVEEEKQAVIDLTHLSDVLDEIDRYGSFSRTFHYVVDDKRNSADLRIRKAGKILFGYIFNTTEAIDRDWMTDIFSRTGFLKAAKSFLKKSDNPTGYSLVYTNIRGFKTINNLFGQQSGDMVIFMEQALIEKIFAPRFYCRLENEHFAFLTENENINEKKFSEFSNQTYVEKYRKYSFTIRCGVSKVEDRDSDIGSLIDRARIAEKSIREDSIKNWKKLDSSMQKSYMRRGTFVSELQDAVKNGEFKAYCQPIVETATGKIVTAESLIRWQHHELGMISPGEFIPLFEEAGKTPILDTFMLKSIADFQKKRFYAGKKMVPISVNLSRIDFFDTLLIEDVRKVFSSIPFPAPFIKLEVTESAYADIEEKAMEFLQDMRKMGVKILLDDYGSGMSSLSTLESFAFDTVKLDMGFIRKIGKRKVAESIIKSTIALAHDIGSDIIAEGVETEEQLKFLKDAGCEMIQGYYFYKPVPEEEFASLLDE